MATTQRTPSDPIRRHALLESHYDLARSAWDQHAGNLGEDLVFLVLDLDDSFGRAIAFRNGTPLEEISRFRSVCLQNGSYPAMTICARRSVTLDLVEALGYHDVHTALKTDLPNRIVRMVVIAGNGASFAAVSLGHAGDARN
jgi:hypothetical protein